MAKSIAVEADLPLVPEDVADRAATYDSSQAADADTVIYRISGAFFGAASTVGAVLDRIADQRKNFILDCSAVPFLDSTAANVIGVPRTRPDAPACASSSRAPRRRHGAC